MLLQQRNITHTSISGLFSALFYGVGVFWLELSLKLEIWNVNTHTYGTYVFSENIPCKNLTFLGKNNTYTQSNSIKTVLEIF